MASSSPECRIAEVDATLVALMHPEETEGTSPKVDAELLALMPEGISPQADMELLEIDSFSRDPTPDTPPQVPLPRPTRHLASCGAGTLCGAAAGPAECAEPSGGPVLGPLVRDSVHVRLPPLAAKAYVDEHRIAMADLVHDGESAWSSSSPIETDDGRLCILRPLGKSDEEKLYHFGISGLAGLSHDLSTVYNWSSDGFIAEFGESSTKTFNRHDLHMVAVDPFGGCIVAHGFMRSVQSDVPELGIAVAEQWRGCGLGRRMLLFLEAVGAAAGKSAIELTTVQHNTTAQHIFETVGYEVLGLMRSPLGCSKVAAIAGTGTPSGFRDEVHMVRILDEGRRAETLAALVLKRERATACSGA